MFARRLRVGAGPPPALTMAPPEQPSRPDSGRRRADRRSWGRFRRLRVVLAIFNSLGGGEVIAILIIGLIVLGPEKLPDAIRKFGNIYGEFRRMSQGFQSELRDAFDEPLQSLRGTAQMMQDSVQQPLQAITEMKAPVVGGAATAEPVEVTATEVSADGVTDAGGGPRRRGAGSRRR